jgi:hypothetical protein
MLYVYEVVKGMVCIFPDEKRQIRTFIKFSIISLPFTATRTTIHRLKRPA